MHGFVAEGFIVNISASGALVLSDLPVAVSTRVLLRLPTDQTLRAQVIRAVHGGFAIEWEEFSPSEVRTLLRQLGLERAALIASLSSLQESLRAVSDRNN